jgi:release factor glutamine methyltransferase
MRYALFGESANIRFPAMTIDEALTTGTTALATLATPRLDAELLLACAIGKPRAFLYGHPEAEVAAAAHAHYQEALARRQRGEPIAYLTGRREFWSLALEVTPACLIPRPETERLVERALAHIPAQANWRVLDLGTGSGAIALALAAERPRCLITATDISPEALALARGNARRHDVCNIGFLAGDWFEPVRGRGFDLIVSNPPYIAADDPHLARGDVRFEPRVALTSGDGMDALRRIARTAGAFFHPGGWLVLEHGYGQRAQVHDALAGAGFRNIRGFDDMVGIPRVIEAQAPK